jgi:precorrin-3B methylase
MQSVSHRSAAAQHSSFFFSFLFIADDSRTRHTHIQKKEKKKKRKNTFLLKILRTVCREQKHFVVGEIKQCEESMVMLAVITLVG